ncbi:MAG TPA: lysylphosphatidylglycerol synthase domain-containing protein [Pedococcus sp.]|jgi:hypothetical protein|nr:lysylphosphatidylglycerol synthase domain-containing protein [Pedococcus sp.]
MKRFVLPVIRVLIVGLTVWIIVGLIRSIDLAQVWDSISLLTWFEILAVLALLAFVRTLNAVPLTRFIPNFPLPRAVLNDLCANLISTIAPPPSDMVLRFSMFKAWGIDATEGFAGVTLNTLMFYVVRFSAPILGLIVLLVTGELRGGMVWTSGVCALVAVLILTILVSAVRAEHICATIGRTGGRVGRRFRPNAVDPEVWATKMVDFRGLVGDQLRGRWPSASLALLVMVLADAAILVYSCRSVDVPTSAVGPLVIVGGFLVAYPLTALPFAGIGVFDAFLYEFIVARTGTSYQSAIVAGVVVWRTTTLLVPYLTGGVALGTWRHSHPKEDPLTTIEVESEPGPAPAADPA